MYLYWILIQLFYWLCVGVAIVLFPITYPFHDFVKSKWNPIWWILHDNPIGHPWYWTKFGIPLAKEGEVQQEPKGVKKFIISYNYSVFRNGCWRLFNTILKQKEGVKTNINVRTHKSYDGKGLSVFMVLRMKFKSDGVPSSNVGDTIDLERTYQGVHHVEYEITGTKYWLYSYCKVTEKEGREFTVGWNGVRPLIRNKTFKIK